MRWLVSFVVLVAFLGPGPSRVARGQARGDYSVLVRLYRELVELRRPRERDGVPDYTPPAMGARQHRLEEMREELASIDPEKWPLSQKVDYRLVRARLNALEFEHRVLRPWARDPLLYVDLVETLPFAEMPLGPDRIGDFQARLRAVPRILEQAKANLTEGAGELVKVALRSLERSDGVEDRQPLLPVQPQGVRGWYAHLVDALGKHHRHLVADGRSALAAVDDLQSWLKANQSKMTTPAGVRRENYDWYLKNWEMTGRDDEVRESGRKPATSSGRS